MEVAEVESKVWAWLLTVLSIAAITAFLGFSASKPSFNLSKQISVHFLLSTSLKLLLNPLYY